MVARLRIFHTTIFKNPVNVDKMIKCAVCLHNYVKRNDTRKRYVPPNFSDTEVDGLFQVNGGMKYLQIVLYGMFPN